MTEPELLPCPFCGRKATIFYDQWAKLWTVECYDDDEECCDMETGNISGFSTEKAAIEAWNTRTPSPLVAPSEEEIREILRTEYLRNNKLGQRPEQYEIILYRQAKAIADAVNSKGVT